MQIRRRPPATTVEIESLHYKIQVSDSEPRNILEKIVWHKEKEVEKMRSKVDLPQLRKLAGETEPAKDFLGAITQSKYTPALIAEVKKASPSKGIIRADFDPCAIALAYQEAGASCISVLTDEEFFQGSFENLAKVRQTVDIPLLCKDFIIYPYQIYLARVKGADAVLLIAAILSDRDLQYFIKITCGLGMIPLIEVHTKEELDRVLEIEGVSLVGINNRNLEDFSVKLETTCQLLEARREVLLSKSIKIVSESGLHTPSDLNTVKLAGVDAVLIGESLIKQSDPGKAIKELFEV